MKHFSIHAVWLITAAGIHFTVLEKMPNLLVSSCAVGEEQPDAILGRDCPSASWEVGPQDINDLQEVFFLEAEI